MECNENDVVALEAEKKLHRAKTIPWGFRKKINRIKAECGRTRKNLFKRRLSVDEKWEYGRKQNEKHIYEYPNFGETCSNEDVDECNDAMTYN